MGHKEWAQKGATTMHKRARLTPGYSQHKSVHYSKSSLTYWYGGMTNEFYDKKIREYREKQSAIQQQIKRLQTADEDYYITCDHLLNLVTHASELFLSSEGEEKRELTGLALQNLRMNKKKLEYDWVKPFDTLASYADHQLWLPGVDSNHQPYG